MTNKTDQRFINALNALKAQSSAVTNALPDKPNKEELSKAQSLMSEYDVECKWIVRLVLKKGVPIPELSESLLLEWLDEPFDGRI